jgi:hypothetical protein
MAIHINKTAAKNIENELHHFEKFQLPKKATET